jgi:hypothetical protein
MVEFDTFTTWRTTRKAKAFISIRKVLTSESCFPRCILDYIDRLRGIDFSEVNSAVVSSATALELGLSIRITAGERP